MAFDDVFSVVFVHVHRPNAALRIEGQEKSSFSDKREGGAEFGVQDRLSGWRGPVAERSGWSTARSKAVNQSLTPSGGAASPSPSLAVSVCLLPKRGLA